MTSMSQQEYGTASVSFKDSTIMMQNAMLAGTSYYQSVSHHCRKLQRSRSINPILDVEEAFALSWGELVSCHITTDIFVADIPVAGNELIGTTLTHHEGTNCITAAVDVLHYVVWP